MPNNPSAVLWTAGILLMTFTLKHFVADFLLQTEWMAHGKARASDWLRPLACHVAIHTGMTLAIALAAAPRLWWVSLIDLAVHAAIDRAKSYVALKGQWTVADSPFWWLFGLDQALHQATNIALAGILLVF